MSVGEARRCLTESTLAAFVCGALPEQKLERVDLHLARCNDCSSVVMALARDDAPPAAAAPAEPAAPDRFERCEFLAEGATGVVHRGRDRRTGEAVAIKQLRCSQGPWEPLTATLFLREREILRGLDHPNIVKVIDAVDDAEGQRIVLEYVPGGSLRNLLEAEGRLPPLRVAVLLLELSDALAYAHQRGVIHRDIKPENILLASDGSLRLCDFGLAWFGHVTLGANLPRVGSVAYLSPEALMGLPLDERADLWAFGVVLFELLAGYPPFHPERGHSLLSAILREPLPDLALACPEAPFALVDLTYRLLTRERERRIARASDVRALLESICEGASGADASLVGGSGLRRAASGVWTLAPRPPSSLALAWTRACA